MRGAHQYFDCKASSLMTPPNFGSGGGSCFPSMVVVAFGEPRYACDLLGGSGMYRNHANANDNQDCCKPHSRLHIFSPLAS